MIVSNLTCVYFGLATTAITTVFCMHKKYKQPELETFIGIFVCAMAIYSGLFVGYEMFGISEEHKISPEQLAIIELGCISILHKSISELNKYYIEIVKSNNTRNIEAIN